MHNSKDYNGGRDPKNSVGILHDQASNQAWPVGPVLLNLIYYLNRSK